MKNVRSFLLSALCMGVLISCEKETSTEANEQTASNKNAISTGQGGSMAQFTIVDEYLYTVDYKTLHVFLISDPTNPIELEKIDLGTGIETIHPQDGHLFIGTQNGVKIYDISNPRSPLEVSEFDHVTSCDPVVANGDFAVATLRGGTECGGNLNQLDLFDISNIQNPTLITTEALINPYGVGFSAVNENIVYVCDGYAGLKAYDISNSAAIQLVMEMSDLEAVDVIASANNTLIVLTKAGIYQFDASNPVELVQKSFIPSI